MTSATLSANSASAYQWLATPDRFGQRYQDVVAGRCRIVAWGSGSVFRDLVRRRPLPLDYIVDNDASRWNREVCGLRVHPPSRLRREDPATTLVLVYSSSWPEILAQVEREGLPEAIPASHLIAWPSIERRLRVLQDRIATTSRRPARRKTAPAIVVQGAIIEGVTTLVLKGTPASICCITRQTCCSSDTSAIS